MWWFQPFFICTLLGEITILTNMFQVGWNHQPVKEDYEFLFLYKKICFQSPRLKENPIKFRAST